MRNFAVVLVAALLFVNSGCPGGPTKAVLHPVSGKVTVGGKPLADCTIQFVGTGTEAVSFNGKLGKDGTYSLVDPTDGRAGAAAGKYKVVLMGSPDAAMEAMKTMKGPQSGPPTVTAPFPAEYSAVETSPKEVEVKAGSNSIDIVIP